MVRFPWLSRLSAWSGLHRRSAGRFYLLAVVATVATLLLRAHLAVSFEGRPLLILLMFPILLSASVGGLGPGLLATLGAALGTAYDAFPPFGSFVIAARHDLLQWGFLILNGALVSLLSELMHRARQRAESNLRLQNVTLDGIGEGVIATDIRGRITFLNAEAERLTGWSARAATGRLLDEICILIDEDTRQPVANPVARMLDAEQAAGLSRPARVIAGAGQETPIRATASPIRQPDGHLLGAVLVLRDDREDRSSELARERERAQLKGLIQTLPDLVWLKDPDGRYLACNRRFEQFFGAPESAIVGKTDYDFVTRELAEFFRAKDRLALAKDAPSFNEEEIRFASDNHREWVATIKTPMRDLDGRLVGVLGIARDITEARATTAALRASEARYRELFDSMREGFYLAEILYADTGEPVDWRFLEVNPAHSRIIGLPRDAVVGRTVKELFPTLETFWLETAVRVALTREPANLEGFVAATGRWYRNHYYSPCVGQFACIFSDITERKLANERLQSLASDLEATLAAIPEPLFEMDAEGRYLQARAAHENVLGVPEEALRGRTVDEILPPEAARTVRAALTAARQTGTDYGREIRLPLANGEHCFELSVARKAHAGKNGRFILLLRDITARKTTEEQLRKLSLAVEQSPVGILITDATTQIEYLNQAFLNQTGYALEELLGQKPDLLRSGQTPPEIYETLREARRLGAIWKGEFHNLRKDGSIYIGFSIIAPIRQPDGRISHFVAVQEDITERKRLGEELDRHRYHLQELVAQRTAELADARERAESANRAKSAFLANMSHEIRTPMNAIVGLTNLLRRDIADAAQSERLAKIDTAAHHLLNVINDILDLSKIDAGRLQLEETDFALAEVLDAVKALIAEGLAAKRLTCAIVSSGVPSWLRGDPTRVRQALLNYASNAVKFTEQGGIRLCVAVQEDDGERLLLRFEVHDSGIGIAPEILPKLFSAFEQADSSTTRQFGGTGLGLAITRHLAHLMGGTAGANSQLGQGSVFWFTARLARGRASPSAAAVSLPSRDDESALSLIAGTRRILLAEDHPVNREVAVELLTRVGLHVDTAADGLEAVMRARDDYPDLILMDVQMPRLSGLEATRRIRALPGWESRPILAMTANAFVEDRQRCLAAGMNDFIAKPIDAEQLYATLRTWLSVERLVPTSPPHAREEDLWRARLALIGGLDLDAPLALLNGKGALLARLLGILASRHEEDAARIRRCLEEHDRDAAQRLTHTLKGTAGNVGARRLQAAAAALDRSLHEDAPPERIERALADLELELTPLIDDIRCHLPTAAAIAPADPARLNDLLVRLILLLEQGDMAANELIRTEADLVLAGLGEEGKTLINFIERFDYRSALVLLQLRT